MCQHYVVFEAKQGEKIRIGFFIMQVAPTNDNIRKLLIKYIDFDPTMPLAYQYEKITKEEYEIRRANAYKNHGPPTDTNVPDA